MTVLDSIDKKPIAYSQIFCKENSFFTDSLGLIQLNEHCTFPLKIIRNGYNDKIIYKFLPQIYLKPKFSEISEIKIIPRKNKIFHNKIHNNNLVFRKNVGFGFSLKGIKNKTGILKNITIPFTIANNVENIKLKIDFYHYDSGKMAEYPINQENIIIKIDKQNKDKIFIDFSDYNIEIKDNFVISLIEIVGDGKVDTNTVANIENNNIQLFFSKSKGDFLLQTLDGKWKILSNKNTNIALSYTIAY